MFIIHFNKFLHKISAWSELFWSKSLHCLRTNTNIIFVLRLETWKNAFSLSIKDLLVQQIIKKHLLLPVHRSTEVRWKRMFHKRPEFLIALSILCYLDKFFKTNICDYWLHKWCEFKIRIKHNTKCEHFFKH